MNKLPQIRITEVGPRDGLQNEKTTLSVEARAAWIHELAQTGVDEIEVGAFVSPKWCRRWRIPKKFLRLFKI